MKRYPVKIARWKSTQKLKAGRRREYPNQVLRFPSAMEGEISDFVGKPAVAYREGGRIVIKLSVEEA